MSPGPDATLADWLAFRGLPAHLSLNKLIEHECGLARLAVIYQGLSETGKYEYGIRWRRDGTIHRTGMTEAEAVAFMTEDWDEYADPFNVWEIVRRPVVDWEPWE